MTARSENLTEEHLAACVARELSRCRARGLRDLDLKTHNQKVVSTPYLDELADRFVIAMGYNETERSEKIARLIIGGIVELRFGGAADDSRLVERLFIDPGLRDRSKTPQDVYDEVRKEAGIRYKTEAFGHRRRHVFARLAHTLIRLVEAVELASGVYVGLREPQVGEIVLLRIVATCTESDGSVSARTQRLGRLLYRCGRWEELGAAASD
jgi:hypothetical protein